MINRLKLFRHRVVDAGSTRFDFTRDLSEFFLILFGPRQHPVEHRFNIPFRHDPSITNVPILALSEPPPGGSLKGFAGRSSINRDPMRLVKTDIPALL
jgi:hypothetical protein